MPVFGAPATLLPAAPFSLLLRIPVAPAQPLAGAWNRAAVAAMLVVLPVFLQAPWVRLQPFSAAVFSAGLLTAALLLDRLGHGRWREVGQLLLGFTGSWLGGCLFWGWFRLHPVLHLPIEAFALPLALAGINGRWRIACSFYLASLAGTACTDTAMALTGVIAYWPLVLQAPLAEAPGLLTLAGRQLLHPSALLTVAAAGSGLILVARRLWPGGSASRIAAAVLLTTLVVDGLFLAAALLSPRLSGLI
ncbi:DUF3120 domain-containing protein [Synechococcus sp. Tobar12-5m-g]|uniref:DUF3120 domain-containing protein n=1 Tax=unclassified Synechococcus TaxID=2626047 RepID=UPI0020CB78BE|nr:MULTISPECIES: DUF3120 domain-containing protein [unclassified Synechococcus]MCP9772479.1 DUF3120 domain-containing protein [Synechococcus sp. Tobar12-5m-g]MCP9873318.1 DUF3120 domain-containing protein [Synechococcus sp. Cruz CV-v-12]